MRIVFLLLGCLFAAASPARSQQAAPPDQTEVEIMFWKAAQSGQGAAGYRAYLMLFPAGKFAPLARLRAGDRTPPPDPSSPYRLTANPYVAANGTPTRIVCTGFGAPALFDYLVVVRAGTEDFDPAKDNKLSLYTDLPNIRSCAGQGLTLPVLGAGSYEARYISRAGNDQGRLEVLARVAFLSQ